MANPWDLIGVHRLVNQGCGPRAVRALEILEFDDRHLGAGRRLQKGLISPKGAGCQQ